MLVSNKYLPHPPHRLLLTQIFTAMLNMGIYFMKYVLGDEDLLKNFLLGHQHPAHDRAPHAAGGAPPLRGMYRINVIGYVIATLGGSGCSWRLASLPLMLLIPVAALGMSSLQGTLIALIA